MTTGTDRLAFVIFNRDYQSQTENWHSTNSNEDRTLAQAVAFGFVLQTPKYHALAPAAPSVQSWTDTAPRSSLSTGAAPAANSASKNSIGLGKLRIHVLHTKIHNLGMGRVLAFLTKTHPQPSTQACDTLPNHQ